MRSVSAPRRKYAVATLRAGARAPYCRGRSVYRVLTSVAMAVSSTNPCAYRTRAAVRRAAERLSVV